MSLEVPKKRIIFCTYSSIYSSIVLKRLLSDSSLEVVAIINSTRVLNPEYGFLRGAIEQIRSSGWRYSSYLFLVTDLAKILRPADSVHGLAKRNDISIVDTVDVNSKETLEFITLKNADSLLAAHFNQLVKRPLLDMDCINIHPSLLPEFKGVDPTFYAMLRNQSTGTTLHQMSESFDTGNILLQKSHPRKENDSVFSTNCSLFYDGAGLAIDWLKNPVSRKSLQNNEGSYDSWPNKEQVGTLRQSGKRLIKIKQYWNTLYGKYQNG